MKPFTTGRIRWSPGVSFGVVSKAMVDFFAKTDLRFDRHHGRPDRYDAIFRIWRGEQRVEYLDRPWEDDPMLKPQFLSAHWSLFEPNGAHWASFSYNWQEQPGATLEKLHGRPKYLDQSAVWQEQPRPTLENLPTKIFELSFGFDGLLYFYSGYTAAGPFEQCLKKYQLLKGLFRAVDCDELVGVNGNAASALNIWDDRSDHPYGGWCFRFSKRGVQVLIRALEEKRIPPSDASPEFVFAEP